MIPGNFCESNLYMTPKRAPVLKWYQKLFKLKTITKGMCIPWGLSWYTSLNPIRNEKRQLVLCIRLPFYWRKKEPWENTDLELSQYINQYDNEVFGSAVLRIRFWDSFNMFWVPDYQMCQGMLDQPPVTGQTLMENWVDGAVENIRSVIDADILRKLELENSHG